MGWGADWGSGAGSGDSGWRGAVNLSRPPHHARPTNRQDRTHTADQEMDTDNIESRA